MSVNTLLAVIFVDVASHMTHYYMSLLHTERAKHGEVSTWNMDKTREGQKHHEKCDNVDRILVHRNQKTPLLIPPALSMWVLSGVFFLFSHSPSILSTRGFIILVRTLALARERDYARTKERKKIALTPVESIFCFRGRATLFFFSLSIGKLTRCIILLAEVSWYAHCVTSSIWFDHTKNIAQCMNVHPS